MLQKGPPLLFISFICVCVQISNVISQYKLSYSFPALLFLYFLIFQGFPLIFFTFYLFDLTGATISGSVCDGIKT